MVNPTEFYFSGVYFQTIAEFYKKNKENTKLLFDFFQ